MQTTHTSDKRTTTSRLARPLAVLTSILLMASTLMLGQSVTAPKAFAAGSGTTTNTWGSPTTTFFNRPTDATATRVLPVLDDQTIYGSRNLGAWTYTFSGDPSTTDRTYLGYASGRNISTVAVDVNGVERGGKNYAYFW